MPVRTGEVVWVCQYTQQPHDWCTANPGKEFVPELVSRRLAYITDGAYMQNGGLSNFWYWTYFGDNMRLSSEKQHGYNNGGPFSFESQTQYEIDITLVPTGK